MAKVPPGKTVYFGGRKLKAGADIPAELVDALETKPAPKPKSKPVAKASPKPPAGDGD